MFESKIQNSVDESLVELSREIDVFEGYQSPHASRIAGLSVAIARSFEFSDQDVETLKEAALVHDLGELVMDRDYISADRVLTDRERLDMRRHPVIGEQEAAKKGFSRAVQLLIRWHHEWFNGSGYPDALKGDQIPLGARILRVCDTYCALTDNRPYSLPATSEDARSLLAEWAGIEFDPNVVRAFLQLEGLAELESAAASFDPEGLA